jgi:hypothetical protein
MIGVTMTSPNEPGWIAVKPNEASLAFGKKGARAGDTVFVQMSLIKIDDEIADDQFRAEVEHAKTVNDNPADLLPPEMRVAAIEFKGAVCVSYDGAAKYVAGKGGGPGPRYVKALGYTCRHPMIKGMAVDIALSERSGGRARARARRPRERRGVLRHRGLHGRRNAVTLRAGFRAKGDGSGVASGPIRARFRPTATPGPDLAAIAAPAPTLSSHSGINHAIFPHCHRPVVFPSWMHEVSSGRAGRPVRRAGGATPSKRASPSKRAPPSKRASPSPHRTSRDELGPAGME